MIETTYTSLRNYLSLYGSGSGSPRFQICEFPFTVPNKSCDDQDEFLDYAEWIDKNPKSDLTVYDQVFENYEFQKQHNPKITPIENHGYILWDWWRSHTDFSLPKRSIRHKLPVINYVTASAAKPVILDDLMWTVVKRVYELYDSQPEYIFHKTGMETRYEKNEKEVTKLRNHAYGVVMPFMEEKINSMVFPYGMKYIPSKKSKLGIDSHMIFSDEKPLKNIRVDNFTHDIYEIIDQSEEFTHSYDRTLENLRQETIDMIDEKYKNDQNTLD